MLEQRRSVRLNEENGLSITTIGTMPKLLRVLSKDISSSGVRVRTPEFLAVGTRVNMEINFSEPPQSLEVKGVVRWVRELESISMYDVGVEFENLEQDVSDLISRYVATRNR